MDFSVICGQAVQCSLDQYIIQSAMFYIYVFLCTMMTRYRDNCNASKTEKGNKQIGKAV